MGRDWVKDCVHVNFGMVSMEGGAFHTREGKVLYLDDVLDAAVGASAPSLPPRNGAPCSTRGATSCSRLPG